MQQRFLSLSLSVCVILQGLLQRKLVANGLKDVRTFCYENKEGLHLHF